MAATFACSIITPTRKVLDREVTYASFPAWDGQQGVMTGQSPLLSRLGIGALRVDTPEEGSLWYLVEEGFAQVHEGTLTILTERATAGEEISLEDAEAELTEARARVAESGADRAKIDRDQRRALAKTTLARAMAQRGAR